MRNGVHRLLTKRPAVRDTRPTGSMTALTPLLVDAQKVLRCSTARICASAKVNPGLGGVAEPGVVGHVDDHLGIALVHRAVDEAGQDVS